MALSLTPDPPGADEPVAADASTRDRLLHAAYELLVERGYQATTVQAASWAGSRVASRLASPVPNS